MGSLEGAGTIGGLLYTGRGSGSGGSPPKSAGWHDAGVLFGSAGTGVGVGGTCSGAGVG